MPLASPTMLIDRAVAATALSNFGAEGWREGLDQLLAALAEHRFTDDVNARIEARLTALLTTRLQIEDWIDRHPDITAQTIERPVFILGLPRTATTALHAFLANDPQWRYLRAWEANAPVPPPDIATEQTDPRMLAERAAQPDKSLGQNLHIAEAGGPVDDQTLLRLDFRNQELGWPAWSYTRWWRDCDMSTTYAYHQRVLQLLQVHRPPHRWLVKAPWHNFHVAVVARQYPDAKFIMCHRDPAKLIPSVASIVRTAHRSLVGNNAETPEAIGAFVLEHLTISIRRVMRFRREHGSDRFIDVRHEDFNADPFAMADQIYAELGLSLASDARIAMADWQQRNRKGAHGEHRYSAEEFGLTSDKIRASFGEYIEQFGL